MIIIFDYNFKNVCLTCESIDEFDLTWKGIVGDPPLVDDRNMFVSAYKALFRKTPFRPNHMGIMKFIVNISFNGDKLFNDGEDIHVFTTRLNDECDEIKDDYNNLKWFNIRELLFGIYDKHLYGDGMMTYILRLCLMKYNQL